MRETSAVRLCCTESRAGGAPALGTITILHTKRSSGTNCGKFSGLTRNLGDTSVKKLLPRIQSRGAAALGTTTIVHTQRSSGTSCGKFSGLTKYLGETSAVRLLPRIQSRGAAALGTTLQ